MSDDNPVWYTAKGACYICKTWTMCYAVVIVGHDNDDLDIWCSRCLDEMTKVFYVTPARV